MSTDNTHCGTFRYIHHACFAIEAGGETALFDPYLEGNRLGLRPEDLHADWIFVSHGHGDHVGSAFEIARRCGATVISTAEMCGLAREAGCKTHAMHLGGTFGFPFGKVRVTQAFHGAGVPGGHACGFIVDFHGVRLYFAGDTAIFGDMAMLQRLDPFDTAVLPIGGNFTMDPKDAAWAAELLGAKTVIPVHYNTWPVIAQDPLAFKADVESRCASRVLVLKPGETVGL